MFKGRSIEAKKQLFQAIVDNLAKNPGIKGDDIIIVLQEPPLENWASEAVSLPQRLTLDSELTFEETHNKIMYECKQ